MNKLIINGSYRDGFTKQMVDYLGYEVINLVDYDIKACTNCGYCQKQVLKCSINDDMQILYDKVMNADQLIFASPIYVSALTPIFHSFLSRFQVFYEFKHHFKQQFNSPKKPLYLLLSCGSNISSYTAVCNSIVQTACFDLNASLVSTIVMKNTDQEFLMNDELKTRLDLLKEAFDEVI